MYHPEIAALYEERGLIASLYLDLSGRVENAATHIEARWRALRDQLRAAGADEATVRALDDQVALCEPGDRTLVAFTAEGDVRLAQQLDGPAQDLAWFGALPFGIPLLARLQASIPRVVVLVDRTGADLIVWPGGLQPGWTQQVQGSQDEIERNAPGGWSQPRYQHRAEDSWQRNAAEVAAAAAAAAEKVHAHLVVLAGDVRSVEYLREQAPARLRPLVHVLDHGGRHPNRAAALHAHQIREQVTAVAAAETARLLERFQQERGQRDQACDGVPATITALARGQVATLLVPNDCADERVGWFGPRPTQLATQRRTLAEADVAPTTAGRLLDILVRAALGTGAEVHVIPPDMRDVPADGVGALLRYA